MRISNKVMPLFRFTLSFSEISGDVFDEWTEWTMCFSRLTDGSEQIKIPCYLGKGKKKKKKRSMQSSF